MTNEASGNAPAIDAERADLLETLGAGASCSAPSAT
jgi:hypothetical protein